MFVHSENFNFIKDSGYYEIPYFQRKYVWDEDNWEQLIENSSATLGNHFLGSIILSKVDVASGESRRMPVIDGQQRLTTISVLLKVIYDILPQTGRFSKAVLANPYIARWFDIDALQKELNKKVEDVVQIMSDVFDAEDLDVIKNIYKQGGTAGDLSEYYQNIYNTFEDKMETFKKEYSNKMLEKASQQRINKKVRDVVARVLGVKIDKKN